MAVPYTGPSKSGSTCGHRADVVFVAVRQDQRAHLVAPRFQIGEVRDDQVDAELVRIREHDAGIDRGWSCSPTTPPSCSCRTRRDLPEGRSRAWTETRPVRRTDSSKPSFTHGYACSAATLARAGAVAGSPTARVACRGEAAGNALTLRSTRRCSEPRRRVKTGQDQQLPAKTIAQLSKAALRRRPSASGAVARDRGPRAR